MSTKLKRALICGLVLAIMLATPIFAQSKGTVIQDDDSAMVNAAGANPVIEAEFVGVVSRGSQMGPLYCAEMPTSRTQWTTTMLFPASPPQTSGVVLETVANVDTSFSAKSTDAMSQTVSMESRGIVSVSGATSFQLTAFASKQQTLESGASFTATIPAQQTQTSNLANQANNWQVSVNAKSGSVLSGSGNLVGEVNTFAGVSLCAFYGAEPSKLGDFVWHDQNADGLQQPSESPVPSVTVTITGSYGLSLTTVTGPDGTYESPDLPPGNYCVTFSVPDGWAITKTEVGDVSSTDSNGLFSCTSLAANQDDLTMDLGLVTSNRIGDYCWQDSNVNGIQDQGEPPLAGCTFTALNDAQQIVQQVTTKADGRYEFANLPEGNICIHMTPPAGQQGQWRITVVDAGDDDTVDSDANPVTAFLGCLDIYADTVNLTFDAGLVVPKGAADPFIDSKVSSTTEITPGQTVVYTITYGNNGPAVADDVEITDQLPDNMSVVELPSNCTFDHNNIMTCGVGDLLAHQVNKLVVTLRASTEITANTLTVNRVWINAISNSDLGNDFAQAYVGIKVDDSKCYVFMPLVCNNCGNQVTPPPDPCKALDTVTVEYVIWHPIAEWDQDGQYWNIKGVYTETKAISMTANSVVAVPDISYEAGFPVRIRIRECYQANPTANCTIILYGSLDDYQRTQNGELIADATHEDAAELWRLDVDWQSVTHPECRNHAQIAINVDP